MAGLLIVIICAIAIPVLIIIFAVKATSRLKRKHSELVTKFSALNRDHQVLLMEKLARKQAFMNFSNEYPALYAEYEQAVRDIGPPVIPQTP